jgi:hypothetical protein
MQCPCAHGMARDAQREFSAACARSARLVERKARGSKFEKTRGGVGAGVRQRQQVAAAAQTPKAVTRAQ